MSPQPTSRGVTGVPPLFTAHTPPLPRRGFTLIELLVVIAIIGLLTTVGLILANRVTGGGKARLTSDTIRILDTLVSAYQGDVGEKIPSRYTDGQGTEFPIIDAQLSMAPAGVYNPDTNPAEPSLALFLLAARESTSVDAAIKGLESKLVTYGPAVSATHFGMQDNPRDRDNNIIQAVSIKDGWGNPIRFVHPKLDGGYGDYVLSTNPAVVTRAAKTVSVKGPGGVSSDKAYLRSIRNAAGAVGSGDEGKCPGNQPYFYSAGNDKNPGNREDNVYSTKPTYPSETAKEP